MVIFILHYTLLSSSHNNIQHHYILLFIIICMLYYDMPSFFFWRGRIHQVAPRKQAWVWCPTDLTSACRLFAHRHCYALHQTKTRISDANVSQKIVVNKLNLPKRLENSVYSVLRENKENPVCTFLCLSLYTGTAPFDEA